MGRKFHYVTYWEVRVGGRVYENSRTKERADEIVPILRGLYNAEVTVQEKKQRVYR